MTKRIFRSILAIAVAVLLLCFTVIMGVLYGVFSKDRSTQLKAELSIAAHGAQTGGLAWLEGLNTDNCRLTLISPTGTVLYDSAADAATMENHAAREEVAEAIANGSGESERISSTLTEKTLYQAKRLPDGSVLRISVTSSSVISLVLEMLTPVIIILAAAIALSAFLASRIAKRTVAPLNALDLEHPLENDAYDELSPLLLRIAHQQRQISAQMRRLNEKQGELAAITGSMNEGLVLLNEKGIIVSINPAAQRLFQTDASCVGLDFLTVERSSEVCRIIKTAAEDGRGQARLQLDGRQYELDASRISTDGHAVGTALIIFDVTEKAKAEQQRREFTANVSHELKTPLQSIMGSAELMENGLVKQEDIPRFVGHIRTETTRLLTLINDIIRLSQLDEGGELPWETVDLYQIAAEAVKALDDAAKAKRVSLSLTGSSIEVNGVRGLLYEIVYNLCDNAIKYNVDGGAAQVSVTAEQGVATLLVSDTGIGIPPEHHSRVFERFYRVDKSHSKETGGTGLGLSIVKHAVLIHHGNIDMHSKVGQGTLIKVTLPTLPTPS